MSKAAFKRGMQAKKAFAIPMTDKQGKVVKFRIVDKKGNSTVVGNGLSC